MPKDNKNWKPELRKFHVWLSANEDYLAMLSHGSIATGDPWIPGFSDYDIIIVYKQDPLNNFIKAKAYLEKAKFSDHFHFYPLSEEQLLGRGTNTFGFSNTFRTKLLFGKDVLKRLNLPERKASLQLYWGEIEKEKASLQIFLVNSGYKGVEKIRKEFWTRFKHIFMLLAIKIYADTGKYPPTREEVVKNLKSPPELVLAWQVLHKINEKNKAEILQAAQRLLDYLKKH